MFTVVILLMAVLTALPHCPSVAIRGILLSVVVAMVTPVTLLFELAVAPLLPVVVLTLGATTRFGGVELVLRGGFLDIIGAQVLLGVVVHMEALLFPQVEHTRQTQQQEKEQGSAHSPTHYGAQVTLGYGLECRGAEEDMALFIH